MTTIKFLSAGPSRSGKQVQARFNCGKVHGSSNRPSIKCWTMSPKMAEEFQKQFQRGGASRENITFQLLAATIGGDSAALHAVARRPEPQAVCSRALAALCATDARSTRKAAQREKAERALAAWAQIALRNGMPDARLREIFEEAIVQHTHNV